MRTNSSIGLGLLMALGSIFTMSADTPVVDRFTFARPPAPESTVDPKGRLGVTIERWSTDSERDRLFTDLAQSAPDKLLEALRDAPNAGTMSWPGGTLYSVRYARRIARPDGGTDAVFVVDRPLWLWWEPKPASTPYPYSVIQARLGRDGAGEGRVSLGVPVTSDKALGVVLSDYAKAPAVLTDLRHERQAT
jgi:hypothetical protein